MGVLQARRDDGISSLWSALPGTTDSHSSAFRYKLDAGIVHGIRVGIPGLFYPSENTMKQGTIDLLNSERGTLCVLLVIAVTVLVIVGKVSAEDWLAYTKWIAITLVAGKTVTSAIETMAAGQTDRAAIAVAGPTVAKAQTVETKIETSTTPVS